MAATAAVADKDCVEEVDPEKQAVKEAAAIALVKATSSNAKVSAPRAMLS